jgi:hypothetical protein
MAGTKVTSGGGSSSMAVSIGGMAHASKALLLKQHQEMLAFACSMYASFKAENDSFGMMEGRLLIELAREGLKKFQAESSNDVTGSGDIPDLTHDTLP